MKNCLLLFTAVSLLGSCNSKIDFGPDEGISYRDTQNLPMGPTDNSDWTQDGKWNKEEVALFRDDLKNVNVNAESTNYVSGMSFFANPVRSNTGYLVYLANSANGRLHTVFVDKKYNVVARYDQAVTTGRYGVDVQFDFPANKFKNKEIYRLYYVFYAPDGSLRYKGHGDIKIGQ